MKKYKVTAIITLFCGLIQLTDAQASVRKGSLKETKKKGVYEIKEPIQFKAGEEITVEEGTLGRDQAECLEESGKSGSNSGSEKIEELTAEATAIWEKNDELKTKFPTV